jgi:OOP family OmpA-OmpF porin
MKIGLSNENKIDLMADGILRFLITAMIVTIMACASAPKMEYPAGTNAQEATSQLGADIESARNQQMDVISPKNFAEAEKHFQKAKGIQSKDNFKNEKALDELGISKAYLAQAKAVYAVAAPQLNEVTEARQAALKAGAARTQKKELKDLDGDFMDMSQKVEKNNAAIDLKEKSLLQKKYLNLELAAIKSDKLASTWEMLKKAKENNAQKAAPKSWAKAESELSNAEAVITTDRHDDAAINSAVILAQGEARKAYEVARTARNAKSLNSEDVALDIYNKKGEISDLNREVTDVKTEEQATEKQLSVRDQQLAQAARQEKSMQAERRFNQALQDAQKQFKTSDAVVYRQGDDLVIRMKSVNFSTGKADLPAHALPVLSKTKDLIRELNAQKVVVEGHTDAVGSHEVNKRVSQERADAVAKYLTADNTIKSDQIETRGMGDEQPLTTNKTKAGRSENRRVDIVITPAPVQ